MQITKIKSKACEFHCLVGLKQQVNKGLTSYFSDLQTSNRKKELSQAQIQMIKLTNYQKQEYRNTNKKFQQSKSYEEQEQNQESSTVKHVQLHILLYDLEIEQYNQFQQETINKFKTQIQKNKIHIHFIPIQTEKQCSKFIEKIQKFLQPEFQINYNKIVQEVAFKRQKQLLIDYLIERLGWSRQKAQKVVKQQKEIQNLEELMSYKKFTPQQKAMVQELMKNVKLLEYITGQEE